MAERSDPGKGDTGILLLSLISQQPMYGYQLIKELERRSRGYFSYKEGTLYPALHRLEKAGLTEGRWEMLPSGRPRRYYHITSRGEQLLAVRTSQWRDFLAAMNLVIQPWQER